MRFTYVWGDTSRARNRMASRFPPIHPADQVTDQEAPPGHGPLIQGQVAALPVHFPDGRPNLLRIIPGRQ